MLFASSGEWFNARYNNLWSGGYVVGDKYSEQIYYDNDNPGTGTHWASLVEQDQKGLYKTIYDPSPRGYMLPASNAFSGFNKGGGKEKAKFNVVGEYDGGYYFKTDTGKEPSSVFFWGAGSRTEARTDYDGYNYYFSAISGGPGKDWHLLFAQNQITTGTLMSTYYAFSVRPVLEIQ